MERFTGADGMKKLCAVHMCVRFSWVCGNESGQKRHFAVESAGSESWSSSFWKAEEVLE